MVNFMFIQACAVEIQTQKLEPDRPQHDNHSVRFIAKQYSSVTFVSWVSHFRQYKFSALFKNVVTSRILFTLKNYFCPKSL